MYLLKKEINWVPYFGNQKRFVSFVIEAMKGLGLTDKSIVFAETNSGSHAISYEVRKTFNCQTLSNDISSYSRVIGEVLNGESSYIPKAAVGAAIISKFGYDIPKREVIDHLGIDIGEREKWEQFFTNLPVCKGAVISQMDLFDFIPTTKGADILYMDFAWPWRDGNDVTEYSDMADTLSEIIDNKIIRYPEFTKYNVIEKVLEACILGVNNCKYVILSNQSSNFPTPEVLEPYLFGNPYFEVISARRLTLPAETVDNLGKDPFFTEYQYILMKK